MMIEKVEVLFGHLILRRSFNNFRKFYQILLLHQNITIDPKQNLFSYDEN